MRAERHGDMNSTDRRPAHRHDDALELCAPLGSAADVPYMADEPDGPPGRESWTARELTRLARSRVAPGVAPECKAGTVRSGGLSLLSQTRMARGVLWARLD